MGPRRPKVPALEPLAAPQNDEERKQRQRLHVKRTYYKKLNEMQNQRDRVRQLEEEYARLVEKKKERVKTLVASPARSKPTSPDAADLLTDPVLMADSNFVFDADFLDDQLFDANVGAFGDAANVGAFGSDASIQSDVTDSTTQEIVPSGLQNLRDLYAEISEIKEKLLAENEAMRNAVAEHERFSQKLAAWMEVEDTAAAEDDSYRRAKLLQPVDMAFCQSFARTAFEDMWQYRQSQGFVSSGLSVFGWRDKRLPVGDRVRFSLKKLFQKRTAVELSLRGWSVLSMPKPLESMFSPSTSAKFSTVQVIDDDNKILFRLMCTPDGMMLAKTLFMVTRFAIPNGFVVCIKSIDPGLLVPSQLPPGVIEKWVDHSTWITFESAGEDGEHCEIEFSGELQISPLVPQATWMLEILFVILRFEGKISGPKFSLC